MPIKTLVAFAITIASTACITEQPDEPDLSSEEFGLYGADVEILHTCECTNVYKTCGSGDFWWLAKGQTCRWSDTGGTCGNSYPPVCGTPPWEK